MIALGNGSALRVKRACLRRKINLPRRLISSIGHFSSRYSPEQNDEAIDEAIEREIEQHGITIPVGRVLPGELARFQA